jgi:LynF/TruF/PatF family peptide O-prenyltransferase
MRTLLRMYEFHKKEFGIKNNALFRLVEAYVSRPPCSLLECSIKILPNGIHAKRVRFGYEQENIGEGLPAILQFLDRISTYGNVNLSRAVLSRIIDEGFDVSRVMAAGVGLDYRGRTKGSKVKCYFMVKDYPEMVNRVLSLHVPVAGIGDYPRHDSFMFGIDMYFDGRTGVEIYPFLDRQNLRDSGLIERLGLKKAIESLREECNLLHVSFDRNGNRILHFHPIRTTRFVRLIGNRQLSLVYSSVQIIKYLLSRLPKAVPIGVNLALVEDEIISNNLRNMNLQYAITSRS